MCGRYASARARDDLARAFSAERLEGDELPADYNVAPTDDIYIVLNRSSPETDAVRTLRPARWGLLPAWSDRQPGRQSTSDTGAPRKRTGPPLINARIETVQRTPAFRGAITGHRCLIPADGYYEWQATDSGKQPYFQRSTDGTPLVFAGLYAWRKDPDLEENDPAAWSCSASILTAPARDDLAWLHDRMPVMLEPDGWTPWLDRATDAETALAVADRSAVVLESHPVSRAVNAVRNDGPALIEPVTDLDG